MMVRLRTYLFELILWILLPTIAGWILVKIFPGCGFSSFPVIPASMIVLGTIFYPVLKKIPVIPEQRRILYFYLNIVVKMALSLMIILFVILNDRTNALVFTITFFVFYILLMIFEIQCFMKAIKLAKKK
jgi:hypothetical protein